MLPFILAAIIGLFAAGNVGAIPDMAHHTFDTDVDQWLDPGLWLTALGLTGGGAFSAVRNKGRMVKGEKLLANQGLVNREAAELIEKADRDFEALRDRYLEAFSVVLSLEFASILRRQTRRMQDAATRHLNDR